MDPTGKRYLSVSSMLRGMGSPDIADEVERRQIKRDVKQHKKLVKLLTRIRKHKKSRKLANKALRVLHPWLEK